MDRLSLWSDLPFDYITNRYLLALSPRLNVDFGFTLEFLMACP